MTTEESIRRRRLRNQWIAPAAQRRTPADVVRHLGAVQAQDHAAAKWAVGLRACGPEATDADVERAIEKREIVRTWPMRGTLHFVAAEDARWVLELLTPRVIAGAASRRDQLGIDDAVLTRAKNAFAAALEGGRRLTREGMYAVLEGAGIPADASRGYHLLCRAAQDGLICFGPHEGKQPTFVLLEEWAPQAASGPRDESLAELARRYVAGHGPATLPDLCWWSGLTAADARRAVELAGLHLTREEIGGVAHWTAEEATTDVSDAAPSVHLLPGFDEYLLGYRDRAAVLAPEHAPRVVPGANGIFLPMLVTNGRVTGTWKKATRKAGVTVTVTPFEPLEGAALSGLDAAAARYARFLGLPASTVDVATPAP
jgi:hypothetical protein